MFLTSVRGRPGSVGSLMASSKRFAGRLKPVVTLASGTGIYGLGVWAALAVLARTAPPEELGSYALAVAISSPLVLLASAGYRTVIATSPPQERPALQAALAARALPQLAALGVALGLAALAFSDLGLKLVAAVTGAKLAESTSEAAYGYLQANRRFIPVAISQASRGLAIVIGFLIGRTLLDSTVGAISIQIILWATIAYRDVSMVRETRYRWRSDYRDAVSLLRITFPLGLVALGLSLIPNIPRYVADWLLTREDLALLAAASYPSVVLGILVTSVGHVVAPTMGASASQGDLIGFKRTFGGAAAMLLTAHLAAAAVAVTMGDRLLGFLYGEYYARADGLLALLFIANGVASVVSMYGFAMTASRMYGHQLLMIMGGLSAVAMGSLLVVSAGINGAAYAQGIAYVTQLIIANFVLRQGLLRTVAAR